ncbi:MAG: S8 family peptidase [Betaproteobacteria bacterium]
MNRIARWIAKGRCLLARLTEGRRRCARKIVTFAPGTTEEEAERILRSLGGRMVKPLPLINGALCEIGQAADLTAVSAHQQVARVDDDLQVTAYPLGCWFRNPSAPRPGEQTQPPESVPWGVARIGAPALWDQEEGAGVSVAILDTGVDLNHPDLFPNLAAGVNILNPRRPPMDDNGHGTHVAGIIAAVQNGVGVVGVAPRVRICPVKVLDRQGEGRLSDVVQGLEWCVKQGIRIINLSLGAPEGNPTFAAAVGRVQEAGAVLVAAAGNAGPDPDTIGYPARYPQTIAVGATTQADTVADFSSRGAELDLVAPGENIPSTWPGGGYRTLSGTSMAAPHVSGLAALLLAREPGLSPGEVKLRLQESAEQLPGWSPEAQGAGLVNGPRAVGSALLEETE